MGKSPLLAERIPNLADILKDQNIIDEAKVWLEGAFASQQPDGYFGPINERNGKRELWAQMYYALVSAILL